MTSSSSVGEALRGCARLVDGIGADGFARELLAVLRVAAGVDHVVAYALAPARVDVLAASSADGGTLAHDNAQRFTSGGYWRSDPAVRAALNAEPPVPDELARVSPGDIADAETRDLFYARAHVHEKVFLSGARGGSRVGLSAFRTVHSGPFCANALATLGALASPLVSCLAKHVSLTKARAAGAPALSSVPEIEATLRAWPEPLTRRELEVLARMLFGLSITGIALELEIGEESVATYRKRAFRRLGIATRNELLGRYLASV
jgi:DNA-binding CsgD family transcriptional regulator